MNSSEMDRMMRARELFAFLTVTDGAWPIIRVDGIGFTKYTASAGYDKPFDQNFHARMVETAMHLLAKLGGVYATTHSDEISVALRPNTELYGRRAEKLASVAAGHASTRFGQPFDGRVSVAHYRSEVIDYFSWRQADAKHNALSSLAYWTLRKGGRSQGDATAILKGLGAPARRELLLGYGVDPDTLAPWTDRGVEVWWKHVEREGFNPVTQQSVAVDRTMIEVNSVVAVGDEYRSQLDLYLGGEVVA